MKLQSAILYSLLFIVIFKILQQNIDASNYEFKLVQNPVSYLPTKLQSHDIVFLGTRRNQPPILNFISDLIPKLHGSGVTHIGMEITSDQQGKIDRYINSGAGLDDIQIHPQIDCREYRDLFNVIRALESEKRPTPIALDLLKSKYGGKISRDEWVAKSIAIVFESNPNANMLLVVGNNHILKKQDWRDHVIDKHRSIRQYLSKNRGESRIIYG